MSQITALSTPVLLINFNRPENTARVLGRLKKVRPTVIYFAADAPRENNETDKVKCAEVRQLIGRIDWPCRVSTLFAEKNQGCKYGPVNAIDWLFTNETEGIVLEDDILPDESFFYFCAEMLKKYEDDNDILMISGRNEVGKWDKQLGNYFFTLGGCWGWATWRRAWKLFDPELENWTEPVREMLRKEYEVKSKGLIDELEFGCDAVKLKGLDAWDYQWLFTKMYYKTRDIMPTKNLTRNIGFGYNATHSRYYGKDRLKVYSIKAPYTPSENAEIDFEYINAAYKHQLKSFILTIKILIKKIVPRKWQNMLRKPVS